MYILIVRSIKLIKIRYILFFQNEAQIFPHAEKGPSWSWLHGRWIYNYQCNRCLSPLKLWVRVPLIPRRTNYNIMWYSLSQVGGFLRVLRFSLQNKTDRHDITYILIKVALRTMNPTTRKILISYFVISINPQKRLSPG